MSPFGARLRLWRRHRGMSQLALATLVGTTARHLSFLETGRSRPSRQMVLRLGEALEVPARERNELLGAAGLAPAYPERDLSDVDMAPFRAAIERILRAHLPYPGLVVDSRWNVLAANPACAALYGGDLVGGNMVRRYFADPAEAAARIVNWPQVAWAAVARLRHQVARSPFDDEVRELTALAEAAVSDLPRPEEVDRQPVVCPWFRIGDHVVRTIGMAVRFDPVVDVTLDELRVELTYPYDDAADRILRQMAGVSVGVGESVVAADGE